MQAGAVNFGSLDREQPTYNIAQRHLSVHNKGTALYEAPENRVLFPTGSLPALRMYESCRTMPLAGRFSRDSPVSPLLQSGTAPYCPHFNLTDFKAFDVKCRPNLSTPFHVHYGLDAVLILAAAFVNAKRVCTVVIKWAHKHIYDLGSRTGMRRLPCTSGCPLGRRDKTMVWSVFACVPRCMVRLLDSHVEIVLDIMPLVGGFFSGISSFLPPLHSGVPQYSHLASPSSALKISDGHGDWSVSLLAFHQGELGSIPRPGYSGASRMGIVPDDAVGRQVFSGISRFLRPFIPALLHTSIPLTGSQYLDVKSRPNLFTSLRVF
ncbi:hypothetical protein PR048_021165 [Dryococelus australis]|uniref:Uncharacterized protein n=1 Tax=Dryococelus australis TaxID=614101 RepID=A0ABQ9GXF0_9NEOP|nr:hypothetical protein PR048_021165 [Dryococelus australis]